MTNKKLYWLSSLGIIGLCGAAYLQYNNISFNNWFHACWIIPAAIIFIGVPGISIGELSYSKVKEYFQ